MTPSNWYLRKIVNRVKGNKREKKRQQLIEPRESSGNFRRRPADNGGLWQRKQLTGIALAGRGQGYSDLGLHPPVRFALLSCPTRTECKLKRIRQLGGTVPTSQLLGAQGRMEKNKELIEGGQ